jgi:hypothetical protein
MDQPHNLPHLREACLPSYHWHSQRKWQACTSCKVLMLLCISYWQACTSCKVLMLLCISYWKACTSCKVLMLLCISYWQACTSWQSCKVLMLLCISYTMVPHRILLGHLACKAISGNVIIIIIIFYFMSVNLVSYTNLPWDPQITQ